MFTCKQKMSAPCIVDCFNDMLDRFPPDLKKKLYERWQLVPFVFQMKCGRLQWHIQICIRILPRVERDIDKVVDWMKWSSVQYVKAVVNDLIKIFCNPDVLELKKDWERGGWSNPKRDCFNTDRSVSDRRMSICKYSNQNLFIWLDYMWFKFYNTFRLTFTCIIHLYVIFNTSSHSRLK